MAAASAHRARFSHQQIPCAYCDSLVLLQMWMRRHLATIRGSAQGNWRRFRVAEILSSSHTGHPPESPVASQRKEKNPPINSIEIEMDGRTVQTTRDLSGSLFVVRNLTWKSIEGLELIVPTGVTASQVQHVIDELGNHLEIVVAAAQEGLDFLARKGRWIDPDIQLGELSLNSIAIKATHEIFNYCDIQLDFDFTNADDYYGVWRAGFAGTHLASLLRIQM